MDDERLRKAIALAQQATEADREGDYEKAFDLYKRCLENWQLIMKYQTNSVLKEKLYEKMEPYMARAETIKQYLLSQNKQPPSAPSPSAPSPSAPSPSAPAQDYGDSKLADQLVSTVLVENPNVRWTDIAGLQTAKEALQEAAILPSRFPHLFVGQRKPWKAILLYGPPGTGKTHLARACATESEATFISISSADLVSKWQGESEKLVRSLFEMARQRAPSIIFIDEVDSLCGSRNDREGESSRRIKTEFLVQMEGLSSTGDLSKRVLVIGATNEPWALDAAIRRRFERRIYIPLPDREARKQMIYQYIADTPHSLIPTHMDEIADKTEGFSGADVAILVRDALFEPIRQCCLATHFKRIEHGNATYWTPCTPNDGCQTKQERTMMSISGKQLLPPQVTMMHFLNILQSAKPSVNAQELVKHVQWTKDFGLDCH